VHALKEPAEAKLKNEKPKLSLRGVPTKVGTTWQSAVCWG